MFDKIKLKIFEGLLKKVYQNSDFVVEKIGKYFIMSDCDIIGCRDFLLKGQYTYNQVVELNNLTGYNAGFGFCKELGPIAFIGMPNKDCVQKNGYFYYEVQTYGQSINNNKYYFNQYSDEEDAKQIGNYTVYGMGNPKILKNKASIEKIHYYNDYRFQSKQENAHKFLSDVLIMDIKLSGTYNFYDARYFAYGSTGEFHGASGENVPIQFAIVGESQPVGILNLWRHYNDIMFRDVWKINEEEPKYQTIRFLDDEEAKQISDFKLYYFVPSHSFGRKKFEIEKIDRTLSKNFDFTMDDGNDYRLQEVPKEKVKVLTKN